MHVEYQACTGCAGAAAWAVRNAQENGQNQAQVEEDLLLPLWVFPRLCGTDKMGSGDGALQLQRKSRDGETGRRGDGETGMGQLQLQLQLQCKSWHVRTRDWAGR